MHDRFFANRNPIGKTQNVGVCVGVVFDMVFDVRVVFYGGWTTLNLRISEGGHMVTEICSQTWRFLARKRGRISIGLHYRRVHKMRFTDAF